MNILKTVIFLFFLFFTPIFSQERYFNLFSVGSYGYFDVDESHLSAEPYICIGHEDKEYNYELEYSREMSALLVDSDLNTKTVDINTVGGEFVFETPISDFALYGNTGLNTSGYRKYSAGLYYTFYSNSFYASSGAKSFYTKYRVTNKEERVNAEVYIEGGCYLSDNHILSSIINGYFEKRLHPNESSSWGAEPEIYYFNYSLKNTALYTGLGRYIDTDDTKSYSSISGFSILFFETTDLTGSYSLLYYPDFPDTRVYHFFMSGISYTF